MCYQFEWGEVTHYAPIIHFTFIDFVTNCFCDLLVHVMNFIYSNIQAFSDFVQ